MPNESKIEYVNKKYNYVSCIQYGINEGKTNAVYFYYSR